MDLVYTTTTPRPLLLLLMWPFFGSPRVDATIFVPEEIPSLLSVVYSNLPPIKKGTDSRFGVGFRLGPNADVQFQLELGPQTNTQPIGADASNDASAASKKRHAAAAPDGGLPRDWLNKWRLQMSPGYVAGDDDGHLVATDDHAPAATGGRMDVLAHLRQLYKPQPTADTRRSGTTANRIWDEPKANRQKSPLAQ